MDADQETKWKDYDSIVASYRQMADIRFKLLALLPSISGLAVGIISFDLEAFKAAPLPRLLTGILGFALTLGLVFYDKRNSELYFGLAQRAGELEEEIGATQFTKGRDRKLRFFGIFGVNHSSGLSLIYGAVLGAWLFPIFCGVFWGANMGAFSFSVPTPSTVLKISLNVPTQAAILASIAAMIMFCELQRLGSPAKGSK